VPLEEHAEIQITDLELMIGVAEQEIVLRLTQRVTETANDLGKERVGEVRDDHTDRIPATRLETARQLVWPVAEFVDCVLHALTSLV
jgi:hypothetical protein